MRSVGGPAKNSRTRPEQLLPRGEKLQALTTREALGQEGPREIELGSGRNQIVDVETDLLRLVEGCLVRVVVLHVVSLRAPMRAPGKEPATPVFEWALNAALKWFACPSASLKRFLLLERPTFCASLD